MVLLQSKNNYEIKIYNYTFHIDLKNFWRSRMTFMSADQYNEKD